MDIRLSRDGRRFFAALIPNKHSIYPQYLPGWASQIAGRTEYDIFLDDMARAGLKTVDLRQPLRSLSIRELVYFKTDTHWNKVGALTAYNAIATEIGRADWVMDVDRVLGSPVDRREGDLARFLGVRDLLADSDRRLLIDDPRDRAIEWGDQAQRDYKVQGDGGGGTVLIIGDSFSRNFFRPFFSRHVSRLVWVHHRGCLFDQSVIDESDPDIVLFLLVEREIKWCGENLSPVTPPQITVGNFAPFTASRHRRSRQIQARPKVSTQRGVDRGIGETGS